MLPKTALVLLAFSSSPIQALPIHARIVDGKVSALKHFFRALEWINPLRRYSNAMGNMVDWFGGDDRDGELEQSDEDKVEERPETMMDETERRVGGSTADTDLVNDKGVEEGEKDGDKEPVNVTEETKILAEINHALKKQRERQLSDSHETRGDSRTTHDSAKLSCYFRVSGHVDCRKEDKAGASGSTGGNWGVIGAVAAMGLASSGTAAAGAFALTTNKPMAFSPTPEVELQPMIDQVDSTVDPPGRFQEAHPEDPDLIQVEEVSQEVLEAALAGMT